MIKNKVHHPPPASSCAVMRFVTVYLGTVQLGLVYLGLEKIMNRVAVFVVITFILAHPAVAGDWPGFLGPNGIARSVEATPTTWSNTENLLWKFDLPGSGSSSPIVVKDRVIVTCYVGDRDAAKRVVICVDKNTGTQLWASEFPIDYREDGFQGYITEHGYASNTPVSDGEHLFVFLGKGGVHSLDLDGNKLWSVDVGKQSSNRLWGSAASLVLYGNSVIVNAAEEARAVVALDKATGKELWRQTADMLELTYGTPRLVKLNDGTEELVLGVPEEIWAMNPDTGKLKWYAETPMTGNVSPSVIVDGETIYSFGGYRSSGSIAVRAGGQDDVTDSHVIWTNRSSSYVATPLLHDGHLYWIDDNGIAFCTSAKDGEVVYRERVQDMKSGRPVYASPVLIGERFTLSRGVVERSSIHPAIAFHRSRLMYSMATTLTSTRHQSSRTIGCT